MTTFKDISSKTKQQIYNSHIPYPNQIKLISLPSKLNSFYTHYQPKLQHPIEDPAICLFCAQVVNLQKPNYGDTLGSCTTHTQWECINGQGIGIFLIPRNNCFLLLNKGGRGSFFESCYVDEYGESDEDCKKGHDLYFCQEKYDSFVRDVWLSHGVGNMIARKLETQVDIGGWMTL
ncbi:unnamed protein product [Ambrosiozyma monospora]|uniref:Unnamed protein product n=1 Tax=Ambrosiozyma monospora TaxID=43982 RepID=A0ACB5TVX2_AMBMO|nr:unnamed protein product [Ambrosiozyma monospora]